MTDKAREFFWNDPEVPWFGASLFALVDEKEEALRWLEHSVGIEGVDQLSLVCWTGTRSSPTSGANHVFKKLMERVKYEWEHFEG